MQLHRLARAHVDRVPPRVEPPGRLREGRGRVRGASVRHHRALPGLDLHRAAPGAHAEGPLEHGRARASHRPAQHEAAAAAHLAVADLDLDDVAPRSRELGPALLQHRREHGARGNGEHGPGAERHRHPRELEAGGGVGRRAEAVAGAQRVAHAEAAPRALRRQLGALHLPVDPPELADRDAGGGGARVGGRDGGLLGRGADRPGEHEGERHAQVPAGGFVATRGPPWCCG